MNTKIKELEADSKELSEKYTSIKSELEDLKSHILQEHINSFNKGLWQATFFCKEVDASDSKYDVNKDIINGRLVDEVDTSGELIEEVAIIGDKGQVGEKDVIMVEVAADPTV